MIWHAAPVKPRNVSTGLLPIPSMPYRVVGVTGELADGHLR